MRGVPRNHAALLWIMLLTLASTMTTLALACATPFAALAALASVHLRGRDGAALMLMVWAASQIVGFALLGYPHDAGTFGWAAGLAFAALVSFATARAGGAAIPRGSAPARLALSYGAAFVGFTAAAVLCALVLGGAGRLLAPALLLRQFVRGGAILIGLLALYHALVALGVPRARAVAA